MRYNSSMAEIIGQKALEITVPTVNRRRKEKVVAKEVNPNRRLLAKDSHVYSMPGEDLDQNPIGKTQQSGWVEIINDKGQLTAVKTTQDIPLYTPDKIPTILENGAVVYASRKRLLKR